MPDILPDSRARDTRGRIFNTPLGTLVPIFCANCGAPGGHCPEENMTFLFYQCQPCAERLGPIIGTYLMPDEVFQQKVLEEQLESHGRPLSQLELQAEVTENPDSALSKLLTGR